MKISNISGGALRKQTHISNINTYFIEYSTTHDYIHT